MNPLEIHNSITINAPAQAVWDALVNPEKTKLYMFGCETVSDWQIGSTLLWRGSWEGKEMIFVKGTIVQLIPNQLLEYTVIDPNNADIPDVPENYLHVTYSLSEQNGSTTLDVTQGDYNLVAKGAERYQESYNNGEGWNPILVQIKALVETSNQSQQTNI